MYLKFDNTDYHKLLVLPDLCENSPRVFIKLCLTASEFIFSFLRGNLRCFNLNIVTYSAVSIQSLVTLDQLSKLHFIANEFSFLFGSATLKLSWKHEYMPFSLCSHAVFINFSSEQ